MATEIGLLLALYATHSVVRVLAGADPGAAQVNGLHVLSLERAQGLDHEAAASQWLARSTALSVAAAYAYATLHHTVTPAVLLWLYRVHPQHYGRVRSGLVVST